MRVRVLREKKRVWAVLALVFAFAVVLVGTTTYARAEEDATLLDESNMGEVMEEITESNDEAMALDGLDSNVDTDGANGEFTEDEAAIPEQPSLEVVTD